MADVGPSEAGVSLLMWSRRRRCRRHLPRRSLELATVRRPCRPTRRCVACVVYVFNRSHFLVWSIGFFRMCFACFACRRLRFCARRSSSTVALARTLRCHISLGATSELSLESLEEMNGASDGELEYDEVGSSDTVAVSDTVVAPVAAKKRVARGAVPPKSCLFVNRVLCTR